MEWPRVKVVNANNGPIGTKCCIDGQKIRNVRSIDFHVSVDEIPIFEFETMGLPDIDMGRKVLFSFTPETVQEAATILKHEFTHNMDSRKALIASIESIIREEYNGYCAYELARKVANRIAGSENF